MSIPGVGFTIWDNSSSFNFFRGGPWFSCLTFSAVDFLVLLDVSFSMEVIEESGWMEPLGVPSVDRNLSREFENLIWAIGTSDFNLLPGVVREESRSPCDCFMCTSKAYIVIGLKLQTGQQ